MSRSPAHGFRDGQAPPRGRLRKASSTMNSSKPAIDAIARGSHSGRGAPSHPETKKIASNANPVTQADTDRRSVGDNLTDPTPLRPQRPARHRSHSPKTTSIAPRIAVASG